MYRTALALVVALGLGVLPGCINFGGAPSPEPSVVLATRTTPLGSERTTLKGWLDPRPNAWYASYPLFAPVATGDGSLKRVQDAANLRVCAQTTARPLVFVDPASNLVAGAEPDMIAEAAKRLGVRAFTYIRVPFTARVPQLVSGQCDIFLSGIGVSTTRARWTGVKFTSPYRMNQPVIVVSAASHYESLADLRGAVLAGWTGSDALDYAHQMAPTLGAGSTVLEVADESDVYKALSTGAAAAYVDHVYNVPPAESAHGVRALPDLVRLVPLNTADDESPYRYGALGAMTRTEDRDLNLALSIAFAEMIADGSMSRILQRWKVDSQLAFEFVRPDAR